MNNYEVLKETKICYEYINDILQNRDVEDNDVLKLSKALDSLSDIYSNAYKEMLKINDERKLLETNLDCPHCNDKVVISDLIDYAYLCKNCDENMYLGEGDLNYEWYYENKNANNRDEFYIKIWETEEDRENGESFIHLKTYYDLESAIRDAKNILSNQNYAYLEVIKEKDSELIFATDGEEELFHYNDSAISYVSEDVFNEYIDSWSKNKKLPIDEKLLCCFNGEKYLALDNSNDECYVEEFESRKEAFDWLSSYDLNIGKEGEEDELLPY